MIRSNKIELKKKKYTKIKTENLFFKIKGEIWCNNHYNFNCINQFFLAKCKLQKDNYNHNNRLTYKNNNNNYNSNNNYNNNNNNNCNNNHFY